MPIEAQHLTIKERNVFVGFIEELRQAVNIAAIEDGENVSTWLAGAAVLKLRQRPRRAPAPWEMMEGDEEGEQRVGTNTTV